MAEIYFLPLRVHFGLGTGTKLGTMSMLIKHILYHLDTRLVTGFLKTGCSGYEIKLPCPLIISVPDPQPLCLQGDERIAHTVISISRQRPSALPPTPGMSHHCWAAASSLNHWPTLQALFVSFFFTMYLLARAVVVHTFDPSTWESKAVELSEFRASLVHKASSKRARTDREILSQD